MCYYQLTSIPDSRSTPLHKPSLHSYSIVLELILNTLIVGNSHHDMYHRTHIFRRRTLTLNGSQRNL